MLSPRYFLCAGVFAAWTAANELPAFALFVAVGGWLFRSHPRETMKWFVPGALSVMLGFLFTLFFATNGVVPYYLQGGLYHYEGSYWNNPRGINAATDSFLFYSFNMLVGHHGFFSLTPILVFGLVGLCRHKNFAGLCAMGLVLSVIMFFFLLFKTNNYGGGCHGLRWAFWLTPFYMLALPGGLSMLSSRPMARIMIGMALMASLVSSVLATGGERGPWGTSWIHWCMRLTGTVRY